MATLKIARKPAADTSQDRPPLRRGDPARRVRTAANKPAPKPTPAQTPVRGEDERQRSPRENAPRQDAASRRNEQRDKRQPEDRPALRARDERARRPARRPDGDTSSRSREQAEPGREPAFRRKETAGAPAPRRAATSNSRPPRDSRPASGERSPSGARRPPRDKQPLAERDTPRRGGKLRDGFEPGDFNRDRSSNPKFAPKPTAGNPDQPRLSKRMAELGLCSRREADEWIVNGWVTVDGQVMDTLGTRVAPDARIEVSPAARAHQSETVTILLHKPVGYVSGQAEDGYQPAIVLIHPDNQWHGESGKRNAADPVFKRGHLHGLAPAGRLDIDSTGLLVLTQDGRVARQLIGENSTIEKEYLVRVEGTLSDEGLRLLNHGLSLDGVKLKPARVSWQNEDQLRFVLREGRKRQIRRMCELVGLNVVGLKRVRIGSVVLGKLPLGSWRYLRPGERF